MTRSGSKGTEAEQERQRAQRRRDRLVLIIVAAVLLLLVAGGGIGYQLWRTNRTPSAGPERATTLTPVQVAEGKPIRLGSADAAHTLTGWVDFHCPGCGQFEDDYGTAVFDGQRAGRLAIEVYAMSFHDAGSPPAANGFACAAEAGFGTAYYRGLFANRDLDWDDEQLIALAGQTSAEVPPSFAECVTARTHAGWVESIEVAADRAGIQQTPTISFDGNPVDLAVTSPDMLRAMIEQAPAR